MQRVSEVQTLVKGFERRQDRATDECPPGQGGNGGWPLPGGLRVIGVILLADWLRPMGIS